MPIPGPERSASRRSSFGGPLRSIVVVLSVVALVTAVGVVFDRLLLSEGLPRLQTLILSNGLTGICVAVLYQQSRRREIERERLAQERVAKLVEMNHHVRNALQVVALIGFTAPESRATEMVRHAIERIEWTLREVLPRGWDIPVSPSALPPRIESAGEHESNQTRRSAIR